MYDHLYSAHITSKWKEKTKGIDMSQKRSGEESGMATRRRVRHEEWKNASSDVREEVMEALAKHHEEMEKEIASKAEELSAMDHGRKPAEYQEAIHGAEALLNTMAEMFHKMTGYSILVVAGGPTPARHGRLGIVTVSRGKDENGHNFFEAYHDGENLLKEIVSWMARVYPHTERQKRSLFELDDPGAEKVDELSVIRKDTLEKVFETFASVSSHESEPEADTTHRTSSDTLADTTQHKLSNIPPKSTEQTPPVAPSPAVITSGTSAATNANRTPPSNTNTTTSANWASGGTGGKPGLQFDELLDDPDLRGHPLMQPGAEEILERINSDSSLMSATEFLSVFPNPLALGSVQDGAQLTSSINYPPNFTPQAPGGDAVPTIGAITLNPILNQQNAVPWARSPNYTDTLGVQPSDSSFASMLASFQPNPAPFLPAQCPRPTQNSLDVTIQLPRNPFPTLSSALPDPSIFPPQPSHVLAPMPTRAQLAPNAAQTAQMPSAFDIPLHEKDDAATHHTGPDPDQQSASDGVIASGSGGSVERSADSREKDKSVDDTVEAVAKDAATQPKGTRGKKRRATDMARDNDDSTAPDATRDLEHAGLRRGRRTRVQANRGITLVAGGNGSPKGRKAHWIWERPSHGNKAPKKKGKN